MYADIAGIKKPLTNQGFILISGGERGIRTLDELLAHTPLAGERLRPLGHFSAAGLSENWGAGQERISTFSHCIVAAHLGGKFEFILCHSNTAEILINRVRLHSKPASAAWVPILIIY